MRRGIALATASMLLAVAPAHAEQGWSPPTGAERIVYPGETLRIRSGALGRDVTVRVHAPLLDTTAHPGAVVYALVDPTHGAQLAAELRRRELEDSMFGVTVVTIDRPGFGDEAWEPLAAADFTLSDHAPPMGEPVRARPEAFERFLYEELVPIVEAGLPVAGERILAGAGWGGGFVLRMAAKRPDGFDHHVAVGPVLQPGDVEAIIGTGVPHPQGHAGHLDVNYDRGFGIAAAEMERLLGWLEENGHGANVAVDGDTEGFIAQVVAGESLVPPR